MNKRGKGEGSFFTNKSTGLLAFQYTKKGFNKTKRIYQHKNESVSAFKKRANEIIYSLNNGTYIDKSTKSISSILEDYYKQRLDDGLVTERTYIRNIETLESIKRLDEEFAYAPIQEIDISDIQKFKVNLKDYSASQIDKVWIALNKAFSIANNRRITNYNVMQDVDLVKPVSNKQVKKVIALTDEEEKRLLQALEIKDSPYKNIVKLQLATGMRIGEVLARRRQDIDFTNHTMNIDNTITYDIDHKIILKEHTKTYSRKNNIDKGKRVIPLNAKIEMIIKDEINKGLSNIKGFLFWDYRNNNFVTSNEVNAYLKRLNDKYHITSDNRTLSTHTLRHTYATKLYQKGVDLKVIQYLLGHIEGSSITTDVYVNISKDYILQEVAKI